MSDWSEIEVELIIADYFQMLQKELKGINYSKTEHRNNLRKLVNRLGGSIEFKHQNISAALLSNGFPYINGYKPRWHYQQLLEDKLLSYLSQNHSLEMNFNAFANQKIEIEPLNVKFETWSAAPPESKSILKEPLVNYWTPVKRNYLELEQNNRSIGETGEKLVFEYEKWRLINAGKNNLAQSVTWISKEMGDGTGFDILSKNIDGTDIFIEVKTTTLGKDAPIFFSKRENDFSELKKGSFHLYRIFNLRQQPKMFELRGRFQEFCTIEAINFKGYF